MHLVFVTSIVDHEGPTTGFEIANAVIVDALRRAGVKVTVFGYAWPGRVPLAPDDTVLLGALDVRTEEASLAQKIAWLAKAVTSGLTFSAVKLRAVAPADIRAALSGIGPFDAYILNGLNMAAAFPALFQDKPAILIAHNVEFRSAEQNAQAAGNLLVSSLYRREARLLRAIEERLCGRADFVFTLADEDRAALGVAPGRSAMLPLVTRLKAPNAPGPRTIACEAALIGTWTWQPNRIGLDWFLEQVAPRLPTDFRVEIAGHLPDGLTSEHPGVRFVGRVADAAAFVRRAAVIALCSRGGTGVQLKTLETFELGLPAVTTSQSVRGIGRVPDNCVCADTPEAFAAALVRLAREPRRDVDGRVFYRRQRKALDAALRLGLAGIGPAGEMAAA